MIIGCDIGSFVARFAVVSSVEQPDTKVKINRWYSAFPMIEDMENVPKKIADQPAFTKGAGANMFKQLYLDAERVWPRFQSCLSDFSGGSLSREEGAGVVMALPSSTDLYSIKSLINLTRLVSSNFGCKSTLFVPESAALLAYALNKIENHTLIENGASRFLVLDFGATGLRATSYIGKSAKNETILLFQEQHLPTANKETTLLTSFGFYQSLFGQIQFGQFLSLWQLMHAVGSASEGGFDNEWSRIRQINRKMPIIPFDQLAGIKVFHSDLLELHDELKQQLQDYLQSIIGRIQLVNGTIPKLNIIVGGGFSQNAILRTLLEELVAEDSLFKRFQLVIAPHTDAIAIGAGLIGRGRFHFARQLPYSIHLKVLLYHRTILQEGNKTKIVYKPEEHSFIHSEGGTEITPFTFQKVELGVGDFLVGRLDFEILISCEVDSKSEQWSLKLETPSDFNDSLHFGELYYFFDHNLEINFYLEVDGNIVLLNKLVEKCQR